MKEYVVSELTSFFFVLEYFASATLGKRDDLFCPFFFVFTRLFLPLNLLFCDAKLVSKQVEI